MWLNTLLLLTMAVTGFSSIVALSDPDPSSCILTHTAFQAPQTGPTTTIYGAIMTTYLYCVDCNMCTVTNVVNNAEPIGPFTTKTTSPMLTITRVECIPSGTAITRRHDVVQEKKDALAPRTSGLNVPQGYMDSLIARRSDSAVSTALIDLANSVSSDIPPDASLLSGDLRTAFTQISSAMFALNAADSGLNLTQACQQLQTTEVAYQLIQSFFDPDQIKAIVCWIAQYGYDFNTTREKLISSLYDALWGILNAAGFTNDRNGICDSLGAFNDTGPYLGIDIQKYHNDVCSNIPSQSPTPSMWYGPTPIIPYTTNGVTTFGPATYWSPNITLSGTPTATTGWNETNSTILGPPMYTGTIGTEWSTGGPHTNWTQTEPTGTAPASESPSEWGNNTLMAVRKPRGPNSVPPYPAVPTSTQHHGLFKRY